MEEEYGPEMTTALEKARLPMTGALTQHQAMHILKLVYPDVPEDEIIRCAILCRDFGLHPLMKEVYIIPFKDKQTGKISWATVLGIGATRKMVARQGTYSYLDNTPRIMTPKEQEAVFGEVEGSHIVAITKLRTRGGEEAQGYGKWPKDKEPQGTNKGNTKANMAFIRSERNAFGRLFADAIPQGVDVIDEAYVDVPDVGKVIEATGEVIEDEVKEVSDERSKTPDYGICPIHNISLVAGKGNFPPYCPTRIDGAGRSEGKKVWCKGKLQATKEDTPELEPTEEAKGFIDMDWLGESLRILRDKKQSAFSESNLLGFMKTYYKVEGKTILEAAAKLEKGQAAHFVEKILDVLRMV